MKNLNIIDRKKWNNDDWLTFFKERLAKMEQKRKYQEKIWDEADRSSTAVSFYDDFWELQVIIPLEKTLQEIYAWRTRWKINFDIKPDWQANIEELQSTKYAMKFFLDWNQDSSFWEENKNMKSLKAHYWNGIFYTGLRCVRDYRFKEKENVEIEPNTDLLEKNNFEEYVNEEWLFFPKSIHPRDFYIDEVAYSQPSVQEAHDCIYKETVKLIDLELRFVNIKKWILEKVKSFSDEIPKNHNSESNSDDSCVLYYYFNRITKTYLIVANKEILLYCWYYFYDDGKLPFVNIQHYSDVNSFYAEGITTRVAYLKAYKSDIFQSILSWASLASWVNLLVWNGEELSRSWDVWWNKVNLWRTTWWAEMVQQINTNINLGFFTTVMQLIDQETAIVTGVNPAEQISASSEILGIVEINEANKQVRNWSVDENYDIWLDNALTMMLSRIKQFAPSLLSEKIYDSNWKLLKNIFPKIRIDNMKVEKLKNGEYKFTEDMWKYWYFELKPGVIKWIWVKVVTASTNSVLPIIERKKVDEYIWNLQKLVSVAQMDQTWEAMQKLKENLKFDRLIEWLNDAYDYDQVDLKANTKKDEKRLENIAIMQEIENILQNNWMQNENIWQIQWNISKIPWENNKEEVDTVLQAWDRNLQDTTWQEAILYWTDPNWLW